MTPPWLLRTAAFVHVLHQLGSKSEIAPVLFRYKVHKTVEAFDDYVHIYTNTSKDGSAVVAAAVSTVGTRVEHLPNKAPII